MIFQRPNHFVYCVLAQLLERTKVSKFRFFPWLNSGKCTFHATCMAAGPAALSPWRSSAPSLLSQPRLQVTKLTLHPQPPPARPILFIGGVCSPRPLPLLRQNFRSCFFPLQHKAPRGSHQQQRPATPAQGIGSPLSYQHSPPQFRPPPLPSLTQHLTAKERRAC